jgi:hypothetical protein
MKLVVLRLRVEPPAVERGPSPVGPAPEIGDQHVCVQLRIAGARRAMPERRRDQPVRRLNSGAAVTAPHRRGDALDVAECLAHRKPMCFPHRLLQRRVTKAEEHAHALGRRHGEVIARHTDRACGIAQRRTIPIAPFQNRAEMLAVDAARESELASAHAHPLTPRLDPAGVVLLDAVADGLDHVDPPLGLIEVVAGLPGHELVDRQHGAPSLRKPPTPSAGQRT